jgi:hypothetical protein
MYPADKLLLLLLPTLRPLRARTLSFSDGIDGCALEFNERAEFREPSTRLTVFPVARARFLPAVSAAPIVAYRAQKADLPQSGPRESSPVVPVDA